MCFRLKLASHEFTAETKIYLQFQRQYDDGTWGDERPSAWNMESNKNQEKYENNGKYKSLCDQQRNEMPVRRWKALDGEIKKAKKRAEVTKIRGNFARPSKQIIWKIRMGGWNAVDETTKISKTT